MSWKHLVPKCYRYCSCLHKIIHLIEMKYYIIFMIYFSQEKIYYFQNCFMNVFCNILLWKLECVLYVDLYFFKILFIFIFLFFVVVFYCCSSTVVSIFPPPSSRPQPPPPPTLDTTPPWFCSCVLYRCFWKLSHLPPPHYPLPLPHFYMWHL